MEDIGIKIGDKLKLRQVFGLKEVPGYMNGEWVEVVGFGRVKIKVKYGDHEMFIRKIQFTEVVKKEN